MNSAPLVLLHGYPFDATMWDKVKTFLSAPVITPNLPGFGQTPPGAGEPSLEVMAQDIAAMLDQRGVSQVVLAGFSMGGYVALAFAERYPQRLQGLGLINSQVLADTEEVRASRRSMIEKVRREGHGAAVEAALPKLFSATNPSKEQLAQYAVRGAEGAGVAGISWALEAMARRPDRHSALEKTSAPLLIVHSTQDQFIPVSRAHALAERFPKALYVEVAGAGHCTPLESPEVVAKALGELLTRVEAQTSEGLKAKPAVETRVR